MEMIQSHSTLLGKMENHRVQTNVASWLMETGILMDAQVWFTLHATMVSYKFATWIFHLAENGDLWTYFLKAGTGYTMLSMWMNWTNAQSYCRQHYIDLPTIRNSAELMQINSAVSYNAWLWIGLFMDSWEWSDKWDWFFRYWATGQPSQSAGSGDCAGMSTTNSGKWASFSCGLQQPFICYRGKRFFFLEITF